MKTTGNLSCQKDKRGFYYGGDGGIRPPAGWPGRGFGAHPALHSLPLPSNRRSDAKTQDRHKACPVFLVETEGFEISYIVEITALQYKMSEFVSENFLFI